MDSRKPQVAVGVFSLLYALVGFFVSVVATLFAVLLAVPAPWFKDTPRVFVPSRKRQGGSADSFSKLPGSLFAPSSSPSVLKTGKLNNNSYPNFEDTPASRSGSPSLLQHQRVEHDGNITPSLKPTIITLPPIGSQSVHNRASGSQTSRPPRISTSEAYLSMSNMSEDNRPAFRLLNLRPPWGDKQLKVYRCVSSPHLTTSAPHFPPSREEKVSSVVKKKTQSLRKVSSVPNCPGSLPGKISAYGHIVVKKQSRPLRTQPYEAPYFFPVPTQDISKRDRSTRARTLPQSRRSPFPSTLPVPTIPQYLR